MRESETTNYVRERIDQLESGEIPRRGPGRPRIHPEGYKSDRRKPGVDPAISAVRSTAGKKGQQTLQSRIQTEAYRKKKGRMQQEAFDGEVAAVKEEMKQYTYAPGLDKQDTQEVAEWSIALIEDCIWKRKWTVDILDAMDEDIERPKEEKQFIHAYHELRIGDLLAYGTHVLSPERTGLKNLVVRAFEEFIAWAPTQKHADDQFKQAIPQAEKALPKLQAGSIFKAHLLPEDDPRLIPPLPPRSKEDIWAERERWSKQGRDIISVTKVESPQERIFREQTELEAQRKQEAIEEEQRQQRQILGSTYDQIQQALHGSVFDAMPKRR